METPLTLDGRLDEAIYARVAPLTDFLQQEPREGQPATEKTEACILFDDTNLYIAARNWNSQPEREVANEMRRDNGNILGNDNFTFVIDTFHDKRNGYLFRTNPLGALRDMTVTDDQQNSAWNGIWYVKTGKVNQGWTLEVAIPFKTLRYRGQRRADLGHQPQAAGAVEERVLRTCRSCRRRSARPASAAWPRRRRWKASRPRLVQNLPVKPYALGTSTAARRSARSTRTSAPMPGSTSSTA